MKRKRGYTQGLYKIMAVAMILSMLGSALMPNSRALAAPMPPMPDQAVASTNGVNALLVEENFDYGGTGGNLVAVSGGAWVNQSGTSGFVQYVPTSLTMDSYASSGVGGAATILTTGVEDVRQGFTGQNGVVYLSSLINVSAAGGGTYFFHLKNADAGTYFRGKVFAKDTGGVLNFGFQVDNETIQYSTTPFAYNTTYLIVVRYDVATDTGALYVLESCPQSEPTPLLTGTGTNAVTTMAGILIRQASGGPSATLDGIRVAAATSWADAAICVSSEPALTMSKTVEPDTDVAYHGVVTYTVALTNTTAADITGVVFTDTLPAEVDFTSWINQPAGATVAADEITWTGDITASTTLNFAFTVTHNGDYGDVVTNTAEFAGAAITGTAEAVFTVANLTSDITFVYHDLEGVVQAGETLHLAGDHDWTPANTLMTSNLSGDVFTATITGLTPGDTYEYKYVVYDTSTYQWNWLQGANRSYVVAGTTTVDDYRNVDVSWVNLQWPYTLPDAVAYQTTNLVYGQVLVPDVTPLFGEGRGIQAEVGYGDTATPADWAWFPMTFNGDSGNNDEFMGSMTPTEPGVFSYATRFDANWGTGNPNAAWVYGDLNGNNGGTGFELDQTGVMTVTLNDIGIAKTCPVSPVDPGSTIAYTIDYTIADAAMSSVIITDTLPVGVTYVSSTSPGTFTQPTPGTLIWDMGPLATSGSFVITVTVDVDAPETLVNNVEVSASADAIAANNTASCSNTVSSSAALLIENFDYGSTGGNLVDVSSGLWVAHSGAGTNSIQYVPPPGLSMPTYASSGIGGSAVIAASGEDINRTFTAQSSGTLYYAALVNVTSATATGDYFLHIKDTGTMNLRGRFFVKNVSGQLNFGLSASTSTASYAADNFAIGTTYLVVVKYDIVNDDATLYVLETCAATEPVTPLVTVNGTSTSSAMSAMAIRQGTNSPAGAVDGIRVATTWEDAVACVPTLVINEYSASTTGADVEYIEVFGTPDHDFSNLTLLELEGDGASNMGTVDDVIPVGTTDANGYLLINLAADTLENGTITLLLVDGFTGTLGQDLDTNNDGVFDVTPWTSIVDDVASNDGGAGDITYSTSTLTVSYDGLPFAPGGASRIPNGVDTNTPADWVRNDFDLAGIPTYTGTPILGEAYNTPGAVNAAVLPPPELIISKAGPASVNLNTNFNYVLTVENQTDLELTNVVITDSLPLSVTFVSASDGGVLLPGNVVSWTVATLADDASINRTVTVAAPAAPTTLTNDDYVAWASNWLTPATGAPVVTTVTDPTVITPIADARAAGVGWTGTIQGNVTVPPGIYRGNAFVIQDATGGLYIYTGAKPLPPMALGDVVRVNGTIKDYNGLLEIDPLNSVNWIESGTPPAPLPTATNSVGPTQGMLIVVEGTATWAATPPVPGASDFSITINDGSGPVTVFIDRDTLIDMRDYTSGMQMRVIGFSGNYFTAQVMPRYQSDIIDLRPPTVVTTTPTDGAVDVNLYYPQTATFNKPMDADTLTNTTFLLTGPSGAVSGVVSYDAATKTASFTPDAALSAFSIYTATLTTGVQDAYGAPLAAPYVWNFTTGAADVIPPAITGQYPDPDATNIPLTANVVITFTEDLHPNSVNLSNFMLAGPYGVVPSTLGYDSVNFVVTLNPDARLLPTADYTVTVDGDTADWAGLTLGADVVWSFQTSVEPPMMVFFGDIHNHTSYSDGSGSPTLALSTGQAAGFDFMAITDHSYAIDDTEWANTLAAVEAATIPGTFVALRGFEYTQGAEGHINVYNTVRHACRSDVGFSMCDYTPNLEAGVTVRGFYEWAASDGMNAVDAAGTVLQFNHPGWINFNDWTYHPEVSEIARMTEVGNGSGTSYVFSEDEYIRALDYGWKLGAANNADTHSYYWGTNTDHRTGVLMPELTKEALLEALHERRTFATEDKNFALSMKANGAWMGAEIANAGYIQFEIDGTDGDGELTALVELITDGGVAVDSYAPGTATFLWTPYLTITSGVHYYYVRVTQADGDRIVGSPVWTMGGEDIAITDVIIQPTIPTIHSPSLLTARVTNRVSEARTITVTMEVDGVPLLPEVVVTVPGNNDAYANFSWQPTVTGDVTVTAQLVGAPLGDNPDDNTGTLNLTVTDEQLPLILIDAGHNNVNALGREMRMFIADLSAHHYNVLKNLDELTAADLNPDVVKLLIITAPQYAYTAAELEAIGNYVDGGGSLWLLGIADYTGKLPWADTVAPRLNAILDAVETESGQLVNMRMNDDEVIDANTNNGYVFGVIFSDFPSEGTTSIGLNVDALATWSLSSIVDRNYTALTADDTDVHILVQGDLDEGYGPSPWYNPNHTSNTDADGAGDAYIYNPTWFSPNPMPVDAVPLPIAAAVELADGAGRIMLYGDSNDPFTTFAYTAGDGKQNELFNLEAVMWLLGEPLELSTIAEARAQDAPNEPNNLDRLVWVEGEITAAYGEFFNVLYVQDATGGITVHAPAGDIYAEDYTRGTIVRVVGTVGIYNGDTEIEFFEAEMVQVLDPGTGEPLPLPMSTYQASLEDNQGWLAVITGTVTAMSGLDTIFVDDGSGVVRIFLDGYNGDFSDIQVNDLVRVTGLVSEDGDGPRIRVRNHVHPEYNDDVIVLDQTLALEISKAVSTPAAILPGSLVTYTLVLDNLGTGMAVDVIITDALPAEVAFGGFVQANGATELNGTISWLGNLPVDTTLSVIFTALVDLDYTLYGQTITNTVEYTSFAAGSGSDVVTFTVAEAPTVSIEKSVELPELIDLGDLVTYTLRLNNIGEAPALNVALTDTLPAGLTFDGWVQQNGAVETSGVITWNGDLPGELVIIFTAQIDIDPALYGQTIVNTASFTSENDGSGLDTAEFELGVPYLSIEKIVETANASVRPGDAITYTIIVRNLGILDAWMINVVDILPNYVIGTDVNETVTLAPGNSRIITIHATLASDAPDGLVIVNTASFNCGPATGNATASITVSALNHVFLPLMMR